MLIEAILMPDHSKASMPDHSKALSDSKSVLIVLDDVWYDKESKLEQWETLLKPFRLLGGRCKIVVTFRLQRFLAALLPKKHIILEVLADDVFQNLFMQHALHGLENNMQLNKLNELKNIGKKIAQKMSRSPLVAKVVGNQLREHPDTSFWKATLKNVNVSNIIEVLRWSYERLDAQLQRCFLFFAVFNKGVWFTASKFVQYWVVLDFIQPSPSDDKIRSVEDIGFEYFHKMEANSILCQHVDRWYSVHDLYHDLAEELSAGDCFRVTDSEKAITETTVQHVFLRVDNEILKEKICSLSKLHNLRCLILGNPLIEDEDMIKLLFMISTMFQNLRALEIWSCGNKKLPKAIGNLKNLRYLDVCRSSMEELPDSVSQLYHLQFLLLPETIKTLPVKLSNLIKLRSISKYDNKFNHLHTLPPVAYIGKLTSLQYLDEFHVRKEEGYELGQLGSSREIGGSLRIVNVENVIDKDEAISARLIDKAKLT